MVNTSKAYIPLKWYVGIKMDPWTAETVGFITPDGTNAAALSRKETVDYWVGSRGSKLQTKSIEAEPSNEFELRGYVSRHQGNKVIRVYDPNGYELEIPVYNLMYILENASISHNKIKCECQWVRNGAGNLLIPTHTAEFTQISSNKRR